MIRSSGNRIGTIVGDTVVDLKLLAQKGYFKDLGNKISAALQQPLLNKFMGLGKESWSKTRARLMELLSDESKLSLKGEKQVLEECLFKESEVKMHVPCTISDYTDFYSSLPHAFNIGRMFRGPGNELQPNYLHLPVGYHGRASSVIVSGTSVRRPCGQVSKNVKDLKEGSLFKACAALDFELEMGVFVGKGSELGEPISIDDADDHIFGFVLLNDWSARDIQKFEYVPLGPFNGKNFASSISPWIVTQEALKPFKTETIYHDTNISNVKTQEIIKGIHFPEQKPYLKEKSDNRHMSYDVQLKVELSTEEMKGEYVEICHSNYKNMYWTHRQQLTHHTITGCNMNPGDLLGSGTISGYDEGAFGSLLELTNNRKQKINLKSGIQRTYLEDGDSVRMTGLCHKEGIPFKIGFGCCEGKILPSRSQYLNKL